MSFKGFLESNQNDYHESFTKFRKIFGEFSGEFLLSVGDSDLNKFPAILVSHFSKVYLLKHAKSDGY